jgi:uncharacterized membrane protein
MIYRIIVQFLLLAIFFQTYSQVVSGSYTPLSGALSENLSSDKSPYLIEADIYVSPGTTLTIEAGTILLFKNFTGLHIQGTLYVKGTTERPVIFTSVNDRQNNVLSYTEAAPFDWNGIDIYENAIGTTLKNCNILFSVYGIRAQTEFFTIDNCIFSQNGKTNVSIKDSIITTSTEPFQYNITKPEQIPPTNTTLEILTQQSATPTSDYSIDENKTTITKKSYHGVRYTSFLFALGGAGIAAWRGLEYQKAKKELIKINELNESNKMTYTSNDWEKARNRHKKEILYTGIGSAVSILGLFTFTISFTF